MIQEAQIRVSTESAAQTRELGRQIGRLLSAGMVVALHGDLGAGKTTLTQGIAAGLGVTDIITSPTFMLVREYVGHGYVRLVHMDSYRLGDAPAEALSEAKTFGVEELMDDDQAIIVIEWAERLADLLPDDTLHIELAYANAASSEENSAVWDHDRRTIVLVAAGLLSRRLLERLEPAG